uniref:Regulator of microtubule dynamics protein 3 n=1 Tax=Schistosoma mansoni TaxID=6183 RepID=A0A3Q0KTK4_SCHMA
MGNSENVGLSKSATAGTIFGARLLSCGRIDKRTFLSALLGAGLGFALGVLSHHLLNGLLLFLKRDKQSEQLRHMTEQLASVRAELSELRNELYNSHIKSLDSKDNDDVPPVFIADDDYGLDDDYENYFDVENIGDDLNSPSIQSGKFPEEVLSSANSFQSVCSHLSNNSLYWSTTVQVPAEVLEEIDKLADHALGESSSSDLQMHPNDNDINPGIQAYARCLVYMQKYRYCPEFLWRLARATYIASEEAPLDEAVPQKDDALHSQHTLNDIAYKVQTRRQFIESGIKYARRALSLAQRAPPPPLDNDPTKLAPIYKWLAILVGVYSSYLNAQQRIEYGYEFKELIDTAIKLDASDALSYYLQGRWCYEVYNISWIERQIASRLFGKPPTSTIEEAETAFEKAEELRPNHYAALYLYQAKCSLSYLDYKTALYKLNKARGLFGQHRYPIPHTDTGSIQQEVEQLYEKYSGYL